jgi:hypothetical protein
MNKPPPKKWNEMTKEEQDKLKKGLDNLIEQKLAYDFRQEFIKATKNPKPEVMQRLAFVSQVIKERIGISGVELLKKYYPEKKHK